MSDIKHFFMQLQLLLSRGGAQMAPPMQGSIPGWGFDPSTVCEKGLSSPVSATLHPGVGTLSC